MEKIQKLPVSVIIIGIVLILEFKQIQIRHPIVIILLYTYGIVTPTWTQPLDVTTILYIIFIKTGS